MCIESSKMFNFIHIFIVCGIFALNVAKNTENEVKTEKEKCPSYLRQYTHVLDNKTYCFKFLKEAENLTDAMEKCDKIHLSLFSPPSRRFTVIFILVELMKMPEVKGHSVLTGVMCRETWDCR